LGQWIGSYRDAARVFAPRVAEADLDAADRFAEARFV
jgi:hypothetical protein